MPVRTALHPTISHSNGLDNDTLAMDEVILSDLVCQLIFDTCLGLLICKQAEFENQRTEIKS